jgi:hypothetical protein
LKSIRPLPTLTIFVNRRSIWLSRSPKADAGSIVLIVACALVNGRPSVVFVCQNPLTLVAALL